MEKTKINKIRDENGEITTNNSEIHLSLGTTSKTCIQIN
jgi:hypothetical protein